MDSQKTAGNLVEDVGNANGTAPTALAHVLPVHGLKTKAVAAMLGVSPSWVVKHRAELSGIRGPDGDFYFDDLTVREKSLTIRRRAVTTAAQPAGVLAAEAFELFREGKPLDFVVSELRAEPRDVARLYDEFQALARIQVVRPSTRYRVEWHRGAHLRESTLRLEEFIDGAWRTLEGWLPNGGDPDRDTLVIAQGEPVPDDHERIEIPISILATYATLPGEKKPAPKPPGRVESADERAARDAFANAFVPKGKP